MKPKCPKCLHPGFDLLERSEINQKYAFKCQKCFKSWYAGKSGEPYINFYKKDLRKNEDD